MILRCTSYACFVDIAARIRTFYSYKFIVHKREDQIKNCRSKELQVDQDPITNIEEEHHMIVTFLGAHARGHLPIQVINVYCHVKFMN
jgi:hypothetical protein